MKFIIKIIVFSFLFSTAQANDILPHRMRTMKGVIQSSTEQDLTAIDNQGLSLQPSEKGDFDSSFYFKHKNMKKKPFLDIRISFATGSYEFQVQKGKKWITLGQVEGQNDWQRVKLDLPEDLSHLKGKDKLIKVRILGHNKPSIAQLDYLGFSIGADTALYENGFK